FWVVAELWPISNLFWSRPVIRSLRNRCYSAKLWCSVRPFPAKRAFCILVALLINLTFASTCDAALIFWHVMLFVFCSFNVQPLKPFVLQGRRGRGRPRKTLEETLRKDLEYLDLTEDMTQNQAQWRSRIHIADPTFNIVSQHVYSLCTSFSYSVSAIFCSLSYTCYQCSQLNRLHRSNYSSFKTRSKRAGTIASYMPETQTL
ncbi:hypothetical protein DVH24_015543, partial [Malus domestica]